MGQSKTPAWLACRCFGHDAAAFGGRMYSVYLIDDEELILDELIDTVPWPDNGFYVAGSSTDPRVALKEIEELKPDVVFCDLKMPEMDGNDLIRRLKENGCKAEYVMVSAYDDFENVRTFFQQAGFDYILKPVNNDEMQMVLEKLIGKLSKNKPESKAGLNNTDNQGFNKMLDYINDNFGEKITLDKLAERFGYSKNYICGLFSKHLNTSLTCYLTDIRMARAKELISEGKMLIKEVGATCGYKEYYHFFRVFKAYYGISPKDMQDSATH